MSVMQCACPKCQMQLQLAQALPARVKCPGCQTVFTVGGPAPVDGIRRGAPTAPAPEEDSPAADDGGVLLRRPARRQKSAMPWVFAIGGVLAAGGCVLVFLLLRDRKPEEPPPVTVPKAIPLDPKQVKINDAIARGKQYLRAQLLQKDNHDYYVTDQGAGSQVGVIALAGLTLLECGESPKDEAVQKALERVRGSASRLRFTYSLALCILFLDRLTQTTKDAHGDAHSEDRKLIRQFAVQLMASQDENGGWGYYSDILPPDEHERFLKMINAGQPLPPKNQKWIDNSINQFVTLALWAARNHQIKSDGALKKTENLYRETQQKDGRWGYRGKSSPTLPDATTCAGLIGLAIGHGVDLDAKAHKAPTDIKKDPAVVKGLEFLSKAMVSPRLNSTDLQKQEEYAAAMRDLHRKFHEGSDADRKASWFVITDKSLEALRKEKVPAAVLRKLHQLKYKAFRTEKDFTQEVAKVLTKAELEGIQKLMVEHAPMTIIDALDEIDRYGPTRLRGTYFGAEAWGDLYFLWSVERVGVLYDLTKIGDKDWYSWGVDIILKHQRPDGSWEDRFPGLCDTCFALLFLKQANLAKDLTDKLQRARRNLVIGAAPPPRQPAPPAGRREA
ncbi:MAG TPA: hypothetical protein VEL76_26510 [Gemmataceae bacterium]|nr:hypothetical protein [Gemmataceae bacterium]